MLQWQFLLNLAPLISLWQSQLIARNQAESSAWRTAADRPDLVARIFKLKLKAIIQDLTKHDIGKIYYIHLHHQVPEVRLTTCPYFDGAAKWWQIQYSCYHRSNCHCWASWHSNWATAIRDKSHDAWPTRSHKFLSSMHGKKESAKRSFPKSSRTRQHQMSMVIHFIVTEVTQ